MHANTRKYTQITLQILQGISEAENQVLFLVLYMVPGQCHRDQRLIIVREEVIGPARR